MTPVPPERETDVRHMIDLLNILPDLDPSDDSGPFWTAIADIESYGFGDFSTFLSRQALDSVNSAESAFRVAKSCLGLFDGDQPQVWELLAQNIDFLGRDRQASGRRWAEDLCSTAWRIYVSERARKRTAGLA